MAKRGRPKGNAGTIKKGTASWHVSQNPSISSAELSLLLGRPISAQNISVIRYALRTKKKLKVPKFRGWEIAPTATKIIRHALSIFHMPPKMVVAELAKPPYNLKVSLKYLSEIKMQMEKEGFVFPKKYEYSKIDKAGEPVLKRDKTIKTILKKPNQTYGETARAIGTTLGKVGAVKYSASKKWPELNLQMHPKRVKKVEK